MIDFQNGSVFKLKQTDTQSVMPLVEPLLIDGEQVISAYKSVRDCVIFTDKRVIAVNVQGMTGKKRDYSSLCGTAAWARCALSLQARAISCKSDR